MSTEKLPEAIKTLSDALREDTGQGSYYYTWQSNIAMAFYDEYLKASPHTNDENRQILHGISNNAAKNFLNSFIIESASENPQ